MSSVSVQSEKGGRYKECLKCPASLVCLSGHVNYIFRCATCRQLIVRFHTIAMPQRGKMVKADTCDIYIKECPDSRVIPGKGHECQKCWKKTQLQNV